MPVSSDHTDNYAHILLLILTTHVYKLKISHDFIVFKLNTSIWIVWSSLLAQGQVR